MVSIVQKEQPLIFRSLETQRLLKFVKMESYALKIYSMNLKIKNQEQLISMESHSASLDSIVKKVIQVTVRLDIAVHSLLWLNLNRVKQDFTNLIATQEPVTYVFLELSVSSVL